MTSTRKKLDAKSVNDFIQAILPLPLSTDENLTKSWKRFKKDYQIYRDTAGIQHHPMEFQVQIFKLLIGKNGIDIYDELKLEADDKTITIDEIIEKFDEYCNPKRNVVFERFIFNSRRQQPGEGFETFYENLKHLAKRCEYSDIDKSSIIRDRIVSGVLDLGLQEKLLSTPNLQLSDAVKICRQDETTKRQIHLIQNGGSLDDPSGNLSGSSSSECNSVRFNRVTCYIVK